MIKKGLFKKVTALTLALCLAASPTFVYAADDVVEVFAEEGETVSDDVGYAEDNSSDDAEEVFNEEIKEEVNEEETVYDEADFAGEDIVEENDETVFYEESVVEEQNVTGDVAEALGVDDETMAQLVAGAEISEETVTESIALANQITIKFNLNGGSGDAETQTIDVGGTVYLPADGEVTKANNSLKSWKSDQGIEYEPGDSYQFTANTTLTAQWTSNQAKIDDEPYATLEDAVDAASGGDTITLLSNIALTSPLHVDKDITIKLNGKNITGNKSDALINTSGDMIFTGSGNITNSGGTAITTSGTLTLGNDTKDKIKVTGTDYAVTVEESGALNVNSGTYSATASDGAAIYIDGSEGDVKLYAGTYSGSYQISFSDTAPAGEVSILTKSITNGKLKTPDSYVWVTDKGSGLTTLKSVDEALGVAQGDNSAITLFADLELSEAWTVNAKNTIDLNGHVLSNAYSKDPPEVLIENNADSLTIINSTGSGSIINYGDYAINNTDTLILGKNSSDSLTVKGKTAAVNSEGKITVNGGKYEGSTTTEGAAAIIISGAADVKAGSYTGKNTLNITAVDGDVKVFSSLIEGGKIATPAGYVWSISNSTGTLKTFSAALNAGGTVKLTEDLDVDSSSDLSKTVTLDLNGHKIKGDLDDEGIISIKDGGNLTVIDSAGNGSISNTSGNAISMDQEATSYATRSLKIEAGSYTGDIHVTTGTLTIEGGKFANNIVLEQDADETALNASLAGGTYTGKLEVTEPGFGKVTVSSALETVKTNAEVPADSIWITEDGSYSLKSLTDAFASSTAITIKLSDDVELSETISVTGKDVTLDLNGKTVSSDGSLDYLFAVERGAKLTIISTGSGAKGTIDDSASIATIAMNTGKKESGTAELVIGSTSTSQNYFIIEAGDSAVLAVGEHTSVTVRGGTVTGENAIYTDQANSAITISGGYVGDDDTDVAVSVAAGSTVDIKGGTIKGSTNSLKITAGTSAVSATISGGTFTGLIEEGPEKTNVSLKITGGNFKSNPAISSESVKNFVEGGNFKYDLSKNTNYVAKDYTVKKQSGEYGYCVTKDAATYSLGAIVDPDGAAAAPTGIPTQKITAGTKVTLKEGKVNEGYKFLGWFNGETQVTMPYTMPAADTTLTARYQKMLTITAPTEDVVQGSDYKADLTKIVVTGLLGSDKASDVVVTTNAKVTAKNYNKSTAIRKP